MKSFEVDASHMSLSSEVRSSRVMFLSCSNSQV